MPANARGSLRSSARLSTGGGGSSAAAAEAASAARQASRSAEAAALAARRRARAVERAREVEDSPQVLRDKCKRLAEALRNAKHLVVYTGAGISTAADIPDYRGPRGVWTRLRRGEAVGRVEVSRARPTLTHMALTALWARGTLKFVVSQNCDGLHVRAGLPRRALAELHGDMFAERCAACRRVLLRAFDTTERTARHAHGTRRLCPRCGAELQDTIVHFGERGRAAWPLNWAGALRHAAAADVVLCLGSSLKVLRRYPRLWRMQRAPHARPALYIVNLQWTPKDAVAALKINARCDAVMAQVAHRLRLRVPRYSPRTDPLLAHAVPLAEPERHTTRRPLLEPDPGSPSCPSSDSLSSSSDSDDELPLRRLAERMRAPPAPCPPPPAPPAAELPRPTPSLTLHHQLQELRYPRSPSTSPRPGPALPASRLPPPDLLHAFQVNMCSGDATILLRAHHAPCVQPRPLAPTPRRALSDLRMFRIARRPPPAPPPALSNGHAPPPPAQMAPLAPLFAGNGACPLSARLRHLLQTPSPRPPALCYPHATHTAPLRTPFQASDVQSNGHIKSESDIKQEGEFKIGQVIESTRRYSTSDARIDGGPLSADRSELKMDVDIKPTIKREIDFEPDAKPKLFRKFKCGVKGDSGAEEGAGEGARRQEEREGAEASALAAAIIARAVLLCRGSLYPGLHTILAPRADPAPAPRAPARPRPPPRAAECAWCARHYAARRCQWYGPPPTDVLAARVWRRVRGRRQLCACCGETGAGGARAEPADEDGGGWYGKGYRKGRRRRR